MVKNIIITKDQLFKISNLLKEQNADTSNVRAYSFDWDDNIINMPTTIKMLKKTDSGWEKVDIGTSEFSRVRDDENYDLDEGAFDNLDRKSVV